jgi:hypothetical protein
MKTAAYGLDQIVGQDAVQAEMAAAFGPVRGKPRPPPIADSDAERESDLAKVERWERDFLPHKAPDHDLPYKWDRLPLNALWEVLNDPGRRKTAASVLESAEWLTFQAQDPARFHAWFGQRSADEQAAILEHLRTIARRKVKK